MRSELFAAAVAALLVVGCKDEPLPRHQASSTAPGPDTAAAIPPQTTQAASAAVPPPQSTAPPAAAGGGIATAEGEKPGVTLTVTELRRGSGGTATLKFTIVNGSTDDFGFGYSLGDPAMTVDFSSVGGVHLIDPVNKKKYFVVRDSDGRCVCSRDLGKVGAGGKMNLWAKFPAPADAQRVTVVVPHFMPMDDVPIS